EVYQEGRRALVDGLGLEPGRELRELHQAVLNQSPILDPTRVDEAASEPARGVFVGRRSEVAELSAGIDDALAGHGRLFLLRGEPGIGKTRLADEVMREARARGARALVGRCWEAGGAPAYWPWVQSLRTYVRGTPTDALREQLGEGGAEIAQVMPAVRDRLPDLPEPEPSPAGPDTARVRLFDAVAQFLERASRSQPRALAPAAALRRASAGDDASTGARRVSRHRPRAWAPARRDARGGRARALHAAALAARIEERGGGGVR